MLHIAQPENVEPWFDDATAAGVIDYDVIGISYYEKWSTRSMGEMGQTIARARDRYKADVIVVETAYPFTMDNTDTSPNLLGADTLVAGYPVTAKGQRDYLIRPDPHGGDGGRHRRGLLRNELDLHPLGQGIELGERRLVQLQAARGAAGLRFPAARLS